jgi:hypothetical protein
MTMGSIGKPEDVSPPSGIAITDEQFQRLLKKPGNLHFRNELVEVFKRLGAVVRPETKEEREARLHALAAASPGSKSPTLAQIFVLRKVTDEEFQKALSELRARYTIKEWPRFSSQAWRLFRRLRGDLRDGRTQLSTQSDGTILIKGFPSLPQFPSIREFKPNLDA